MSHRARLLRAPAPPPAQRPAPAAARSAAGRHASTQHARSLPTDNHAHTHAASSAAAEIAPLPQPDLRLLVVGSSRGKNSRISDDDNDDSSSDDSSDESERLGQRVGSLHPARHSAHTWLGCMRRPRTRTVLRALFFASMGTAMLLLCSMLRGGSSDGSSISVGAVREEFFPSLHDAPPAAPYGVPSPGVQRGIDGVPAASSFARPALSAEEKALGIVEDELPPSLPLAAQHTSILERMAAAELIVDPERLNTRAVDLRAWFATDASELDGVAHLLACMHSAPQSARVIVVASSLPAPTAVMLASAPSSWCMLVIEEDRSGCADTTTGAETAPLSLTHAEYQLNTARMLDCQAAGSADTSADLRAHVLEQQHRSKELGLRSFCESSADVRVSILSRLSFVSVAEQRRLPYASASRAFGRAGSSRCASSEFAAASASRLGYLLAVHAGAAAVLSLSDSPLARPLATALSDRTQVDLAYFRMSRAFPIPRAEEIATSVTVASQHYYHFSELLNARQLSDEVPSRRATNGAAQVFSAEIHFGGEAATAEGSGAWHGIPERMHEAMKNSWRDVPEPAATASLSCVPLVQQWIPTTSTDPAVQSVALPPSTYASMSPLAPMLFTPAAFWALLLSSSTLQPSARISPALLRGYILQTINSYLLFPHTTGGPHASAHEPDSETDRAEEDALALPGCVVFLPAAGVKTRAAQPAAQQSSASSTPNSHDASTETEDLAERLLQFLQERRMGGKHCLLRRWRAQLEAAASPPSSPFQTSEPHPSSINVLSLLRVLYLELWEARILLADDVRDAAAWSLDLSAMVQPLSSVITSASTEVAAGASSAQQHSRAEPSRLHVDFVRSLSPRRVSPLPQDRVAVCISFNYETSPDAVQWILPILTRLHARVALQAAQRYAHASADVHALLAAFPQVVYNYVDVRAGAAQTMTAYMCAKHYEALLLQRHSQGDTSYSQRALMSSRDLRTPGPSMSLTPSPLGFPRQSDPSTPSLLRAHSVSAPSPRMDGVLHVADDMFANLTGLWGLSTELAGGMGEQYSLQDIWSAHGRNVFDIDSCALLRRINDWGEVDRSGFVMGSDDASTRLCKTFRSLPPAWRDGCGSYLGGPRRVPVAGMSDILYLPAWDSQASNFIRVMEHADSEAPGSDGPLGGEMFLETYSGLAACVSGHSVCDPQERYVLNGEQQMGSLPPSGEWPLIRAAYSRATCDTGLLNSDGYTYHAVRQDTVLLRALTHRPAEELQFVHPLKLGSKQGAGALRAPPGVPSKEEDESTSLAQVNSAAADMFLQGASEFQRVWMQAMRMQITHMEIVRRQWRTEPRPLPHDSKLTPELAGERVSATAPAAAV